ncbi:vitellogenin receptor Yl-like [Planococcus citri]|uniref:vitellogenin receptor Yl-like n=1 Tax=Planococcus citri TaxID=170843 RepID=UPI0031F9B988
MEASHQACFNTPKGPICCSEFDSTCQECDSNEICAHKCVQLGNKTGCICDENYVGVPGTKNAECFPSNNAAKEKLLVFLSDNHIQALNLFTNTNFTVKNYPDNFGFWATALTAFQDHVYHVHSYPDAPPGKENQTITIKDAVPYTSVFKTSITKNETHEIMKVGTEEISTKINSLAVDWITHNIYFATYNFILVCSNDCRICEQMKSGGAQFINLASRLGLMFWVSDDRSKLMKSSMDGSDQISIFNFSPTLLKTNYLKLDMMTVDELTERIYWRTHYDDNIIHSVNFNGGKKEVRPLKFKLYYWESEFTHGSDYLYWDMGIYYEEEFFFIVPDPDGTFDRRICSIENRTNTLAARFPVPKKYGENYKFRKGSEYRPKMLYVYNPHLQFTKIRNPCPASCAGLCLTRPSLSKGLLNYTCLNETTFMRPTKIYNTGSNIRTETLKISSIVVMCGFLLRRYLNNYNSDMF